MNENMQRILNILKTNTGYVSGEKICEQLNISRTAVWKYIKQLKEIGYKIQAVTNKGYQLLNFDDVYNEHEINSRLNTKWLGKNIYFYDETSSTNLLAKQAGESSGQHGDVFIAKIQNMGRGRLGRSWVAEEGGVYFTILLRPNSSISGVMQMTLLAGLAVCKSIRKQTGLDAQIKWPNDILINQKKVCGILCEMASEEEQVKYIVIGIGVNVENNPFDDTIAYSLKNTGIKKSEFLSTLLNDFETLYDKYFDRQNELICEYKRFCCTINKNIIILKNDKRMTAKALDISPSGELVVGLDGGEIQTVNSGEVSIRFD